MNRLDSNSFSVEARENKNDGNNARDLRIKGAVLGLFLAFGGALAYYAARPSYPEGSKVVSILGDNVGFVNPWESIEPKLRLGEASELTPETPVSFYLKDAPSYFVTTGIGVTLVGLTVFGGLAFKYIRDVISFEAINLPENFFPTATTVKGEEDKVAGFIPTDTSKNPIVQEMEEEIPKLEIEKDVIEELKKKPFKLKVELSSVAKEGRFDFILKCLDACRKVGFNTDKFNSDAFHTVGFNTDEFESAETKEFFEDLLNPTNEYWNLQIEWDLKDKIERLKDSGLTFKKFTFSEGSFFSKNPRCIKLILDAWPDIEILEFLCSLKKEDECLSSIANLKNLKKLHLSFPDKAMLQHISKLSRLKCLTFEGTKNIETQDLVTYLQKLKKLKTLKFGKCENLTDEIKNVFQKLSNLRYLGFDESGGLTEKTFKSIMKLKKLETLEIPHSQLKYLSNPQPGCVVNFVDQGEDKPRELVWANPDPTSFTPTDHVLAVRDEEGYKYWISS